MEDYSKCPKCGGTRIVWNKDINNAFIKCLDCGYYLREGRSRFKKNVQDEYDDIIVDSVIDDYYSTYVETGIDYETVDDILAEINEDL